MSYDAYLARKRFPALDGLRAVCILLVVVWHTNPAKLAWLSGYLGVTIFFVLSGYLITMLALREEAVRGRLSLTAFYVRRTFRIAPVYLLTVGFYIALFAVKDWGGHRHLLEESLPYYLTFLNDFAPFQESTPLAHTWSLGVEEKFYFAWPILGFALWRLSNRRVVAAGLLAIAPLLLAPLGAAHWYTAYGTIMVGCLLALLLEQRRSYQYLNVLSRTPVMWTMLAAMIGLHVAVHPVGLAAELAYPFLTAALMVGLLTGHASFVRAFEYRPAKWVGNRAYGMYLLHTIALSATTLLLERWYDASSWVWTLLAVTVGGSGTMVLAAGAFRWVEQPCNRVGHSWSERIKRSDDAAPSVVEPAYY